MKTFKKFQKLEEIYNSEYLPFITEADNKSNIIKDFGISNPTKFIEFFQAFGFFVSKALNDKNFVEVLIAAESKINGDFPVLVKNWKKFINAINKIKDARKNVIELVNGSYYYRKDAGIKKPYVIATDIRNYYSALQAFETDKDLVKENTADIVVVDNDTLATIEKALQVKGQSISSNKTTGKLTTTKKIKVSWYQVSLKEKENGARLGRVTTQFKADYLSTKDQEKSNLGIATTESHNDLDITTLNEFVQLYNEGWFDNVKVFAKNVIDFIKQKIEAVTKLVTGWFSFFLKKQKLSDWKTETNSVLSDVQQIIDSANKNESKEDFKSRTGKQYVDRVAKYKMGLKEEMILLSEKTTVADDITSLFNNKKAMKSFRDLVNKRLDKVASNKNKAVLKIINKIGGKAKIARTTIKYNLTNSISFEIINTMMNKFPSKNIMQYVSDIKDEMVMGSTNYPVVKLYGDADKANTEILVRTVTKKQVDLKKQFPLIIHINSNSGEYYVVNVYMISKVDAKPENSQYSLLQFNNSGSKFAYKIEGNTTMSYAAIMAKGWYPS